MQDQVMKKRAWFVGVSMKRFRFPFWANWLGCFLHQPRFLRRWYYRKSYEWWGHPSNHHWKGMSYGDYPPQPLLPSERDLWGGCYCSGNQESKGNACKK